MTNTPQYSTLLHCLYDQPEPVGNLGRGTHYSIFRCVERLNVELKPATPPHVHDFAVIWDEDHDRRVITVIEALYMADLLAPVQFIGERKAFLTIIIAARTWSYGITLEEYQKRAEAVVLAALNNQDYWNVEVGIFDRSEGSPHQRDTMSIIAAPYFQVSSYMVAIDAMWSLGTKPFAPKLRDLEAEQRGLEAHWAASPPLPIVPAPDSSSAP